VTDDTPPQPPPATAADAAATDPPPQPPQSASDTEVAASGRSPAAPRVGIVMGSDSDLRVMRAASQVLEQFGVAHEVHVVSAHRDPRRMLDYGASAAERGLAVIVAGAGGAAHLPGMLASVTSVPVIGVPVPLAHLDGLDSLLSIVQMPAGIPVATVAVGGAHNAGLLAVRVLAASDRVLRTALDEHRQALTVASRAKDDRVQATLAQDAPQD
jgi:5-(carboxyamino)imidazole ribonucleotide mutase